MGPKLFCVCAVLLLVVALQSISALQEKPEMKQINAMEFIIVAGKAEAKKSALNIKPIETDSYTTKSETGRKLTSQDGRKIISQAGRKLTSQVDNSAVNVNAKAENRLRGPDMNVPGNGEFKFVAHNKDLTSTTQALEIVVVLNQTILSLACVDSYTKYIYEGSDSNLMEFRYYKSCVSSNTENVPKFIIEQNSITLTIIDAFDVAVVYKFSMKKQELSFEEKIDLMFNGMQKEMASIKEKLWCKYYIY